MLEFQGRKRKRKNFYHPIILASAILLIIILAKPTWNIFQKYLVTRSQLKEAERELRDLQDREARLKSALAEIQSQAGQEREIMRKFDVVREGEELAVIIEPEAPIVEPEPEKSFFQKYFGWIFGN